MPKNRAIGVKSSKCAGFIARVVLCCSLGLPMIHFQIVDLGCVLLYCV